MTMRLVKCVFACMVVFYASFLNGEKNESEVWGSGVDGAILKHGVDCMCLGCQEERNRAFRERYHKQGVEESEKEWKEWDRQLKAAGVKSWSYDVQTKFKSPRIKSTIVFLDGRKIDYNRKIKHNASVPSPVDIVLSYYPDLAPKLQLAPVVLNNAQAKGLAEKGLEPTADDTKEEFINRYVCLKEKELLSKAKESNQIDIYGWRNKFRYQATTIWFGSGRR